MIRPTWFPKRVAYGTRACMPRFITSDLDRSIDYRPYSSAVSQTGCTWNRNARGTPWPAHRRENCGLFRRAGPQSRSGSTGHGWSAFKPKYPELYIILGAINLFCCWEHTLIDIMSQRGYTRRRTKIFERLTMLGRFLHPFALCQKIWKIHWYLGVTQFEGNLWSGWRRN